jgi:uncharacterized membrane protein
MIRYWPAFLLLLVLSLAVAALFNRKARMLFWFVLTLWIGILIGVALTSAVITRGSP